MKRIKCLENYKCLKDMLEKGEKGSLDYFASRLNTSRSSVFRLIKYIEEIEKVKVDYKAGIIYPRQNDSK